jgi:hypothetical protein
MTTVTKKYTPNLAVKTQYKDVWYDSILEASYAVLFDMLGWKFSKPKEGNGFYSQKKENCWLPDFVVTVPSGEEYLIEVKPSPDFVSFSKQELATRRGYTVVYCYPQPLAAHTLLWKKSATPFQNHFPPNIHELWAEAKEHFN